MFADLMSQGSFPLRELRHLLILAEQIRTQSRSEQNVTNSFSSKCRTLTQTKSIVCALWLSLAPVCLVSSLISPARRSRCLLSWSLLTAALHPGPIKSPACWQADLGQAPSSTDTRPILSLPTSGQTLWICYQTGAV